MRALWQREQRGTNCWHHPRCARSHSDGPWNLAGRRPDAPTIVELGVTYTLKVLHRGDLNRQIVRSQACEIVIPEFELTLPPNERDQLTTVEGLLRDIVADLGADQPLRRIQNEVAYIKIQEIIDGLKEVMNDEEEVGEGVEPDRPILEKHKDDPVKKTITITLDDPSGNSFLEFVGSMADPKWTLKTYTRTLEQAGRLGLALPEEEMKSAAEEDAGAVEEGGSLDEENEEVFEFPGLCPRCGRPLVTRMKKVSIPYFKVSGLWLDDTKDPMSIIAGDVDHVDELRVLWISR